MIVNNKIPLVSIITVVFNGASYLEQTIRSVLNQTYDNIEYIIIDGGSTDGTVDIIKKYEDKIDYWISEPDEGISDAFNKGIASAKGEYIQLVNADDWLSEDQIEQGVKALIESDYDFVFGDLNYHDFSGKSLFVCKGEPEYYKKIKSGMPAVNHPTFLVKSEVYKKIGGFDNNFEMAMDYDWLLRAHNFGFYGLYVPEIKGHMRADGVSEKKYSKAYKEVMVISIQNGLNKVFARFLYFGRVLKTTMRIWLEKLGLKNFRKLINRNLK